jgi:hypothetical protein
MTATSKVMEVWTRARTGIVAPSVQISRITCGWSRKLRRSSRLEVGTASASLMIEVLLQWRFISRRHLLGRC